jgi:hypothetical protein
MPRAIYDRWSEQLRSCSSVTTRTACWTSYSIRTSDAGAAGGDGAAGRGRGGRLRTRTTTSGVVGPGGAESFSTCIFFLSMTRVGPGVHSNSIEGWRCFFVCDLCSAVDLQIFGKR